MLFGWHCLYPLPGVDSTHTITNVRIAVRNHFCKIPPAAETTLVAMTTPDPGQQPEAARGATSIDWASVLAQHERWLRTVIGARLGEPQAVDEVMQEVSLAAVRQRAPLNDPEKAAPWLYRLAVRQTLLYRRKQGRRRKMVDRYAQRFRPSEADNRQADPLGWLLAEERRTQVRLAMSRLPKRDAEILLLKYNEDWSYDTLAKHLGISQSAIEARLHRARQRLRTELALLDVVGAGMRKD
jgi:RNA polymerase sigma factor (sigma-70 family)